MEKRVENSKKQCVETLVSDLNDHKGALETLVSDMEQP